MSLTSLSQSFAKRGGTDAPLLKELAATVGSARRWAHFTHLLVVGTWIFTVFAIQWCSRPVPRLLAGLGLLTSALQVTGVPLRGILGIDLMTTLAMPLASAYLAVAVWLMVRGFGERR